MNKEYVDIFFNIPKLNMKENCYSWHKTLIISKLRNITARLYNDQILPVVKHHPYGVILVEPSKLPDWKKGKLNIVQQSNIKKGQLIAKELNNIRNNYDPNLPSIQDFHEFFPETKQENKVYNAYLVKYDQKHQKRELIKSNFVFKESSEAELRTIASKYEQSNLEVKEVGNDPYLAKGSIKVKK